MRRVHLLVDYQGRYWCPHTGGKVFTDLDRLTRRFAEHDLRLEIRGFADVDFRQQDYAGSAVLYQSSQDPGLRYKGYIEDVVLGLERQGHGFCRLITSCAPTTTRSSWRSCAT